MGDGEEGTPAKPSKPNPSTLDTPPAPSYADWSSSMQAYYGAGATPSFFSAASVAPHTPHPYMWGTQHALIPPYGTPVPYPALYPPTGVYAHPNMAPGPSMGRTNLGMEGEAQSGKDLATEKKCKLTIAANGRKSGKAAPRSGDNGATQCANSRSQGYSDASDGDDNQGFAGKEGGFGQMLAGANNAQANPHAPVPGNPNASMPGTNLNIGMNSSSAVDGLKRPNPMVHTTAPVVGGEASMTNQWIQDERELKREKRKQSNRESARRSRLRKQAECEELQARVEKLTDENQMLRDEMQRLSEGRRKLASENNSIKEELTRLYGPEAVSEFETNNANRLLQSRSSNSKS